MRFPDWIIYTLVLGVLLFTLLPGGERAMAPEAPPEERIVGQGRPLPEASAFDERVLVQAGEPADGTGTAFAINRQGDWLTARHVVDGCSQLALEVGPGTYVPIPPEAVRLSPDSDLALISTGRAPTALALAPDAELTVGTQGFHVGFPQGKPGEATSKLLSRSRLVTRGRVRGEEEVLAWAEQGRTRGLLGSLAGISGAPVLDAQGRVVGVTVAESPRRGRIYTTAPETMAEFLEAEQVKFDTDLAARPFSVQDYGQKADRVRRSLGVVKVVCRVER